MSSFSGLLYNSALMLVLCVIYDTFAIYSIPNKKLKDLFTGILVGLVSIVVMLTPWSLQPGVFFDTRWVLLSLCGLFFGFRPTLVAVIIAGSFRLYQGGPGGIVGTVVIVVTAFIGVTWKYWKDQHNKTLGWKELFIFGVLVQIGMLSCMFLMPADMIFPILKSVSLPILTIYPILTLVVGTVLKRQEDRRKTEQELVESRRALFRERGLLRGVIDSIPDLIVFKNTKGVYLGCNKSFELFSGSEEQNICGQTAVELFDQDTAKSLLYKEEELFTTKKPVNHEQWVKGPNGNLILLDIKKTPFKGLDGSLNGLVGISRDITERKQFEEERMMLQEQLNQARKMETVGQLAGGVAHEFNNMLGVILGHAELAMDQMDPSQLFYADLEEIRRAAVRSADITRQLLAFARKQNIEPKVVDLNKTIEKMLNMLRRLIGENIDFSWIPDSDLWTVKADSLQFDQILTNLCINARDAITGVGKITIETGNSILDDNYCAAHTGSVAGEYVRISVKDTGCGMDKKMLTHIFEPFFTTKNIGQGTGLGLAMVYGAVTQNKGIVDVSSEPGKGTIISIYLPRHLKAGTIESVSVKDEVAPAEGGGETILLVEDEQAILKMTSKMLQRLGYTVLAAKNPGQAIRLAEMFSSDIHLLITDVIMPEMNGRELAEQLLKAKNAMKCLFMSGYTSDIITNQGVLVEKMHFIQKPFSQKDLAGKIRKVLTS